MTKAAPKPEVELARQYRREGYSYMEVAEMMDRSNRTTSTWIAGVVPEQRPIKVGYSPVNHCWHIYIKDHEYRIQERRPVTWWPLEWMRFATREVAEDHLAMYGERYR